MKKIITIVSVLLLVFGLASCDILDHYPHDSVSRDNVSTEDLELLYTGLYQYSQYKPGFEGYFQCDMAGGDFFRGGGSIWPDAKSWIKDCILPTSGWTSVAYLGHYSWLYQVNSFIYSAKNAEQNVKVKEMLGIAYFFRALIYYNLTSKYREVPILREPTNNAIAKSSEEECWAFVNENIDNAISMCPSYTTKNFVSVQAAKALKARSLLAQGKKKEAAQYAEELITDPLFNLDDFDKIFRGKTNTEEIFTFANIKEERGITFAGEFLQPATIYVPTPQMIALYTPNDKRSEVSITQDSDEMVFNKYISKTTSDPIIVFRLAEMYLISAEGRGLADGGLKRLNELRAFRGLGNVSPTPTTEEQLLDAVIAERRVELFGEGFRWFDLVRTGKYVDTVGLEEKYTVFPLPQREIDLNTKLIQNDLWK